jgi:hypothetical protein
MFVVLPSVFLLIFNIYAIFNKKVLKMIVFSEGRKWQKILPKSRRGFKKWTKINVQFSIPQVFWRQLVFKTGFRALCSYFQIFAFCTRA